MTDGVKPDYDAVLADLRRKREALDTAIAAIEQIAGLPSPAAAPQGGANRYQDTPPAVIEIPRNAFFGLTMPGAIKKYLGMALQRKTTLEIANALKTGGYASRKESNNFNSMVYTSLMRLEKNHEVVRVGKLWGLAEWASGARESRKTNKTDEKITEDE